MQPNKLPIGYWIKQAGELLTKKIDEIQASFGLTRTAWQVLHVIGEQGLIEKSELADFMSPFLDANPLDDVLSTLQMRELVNEHEHKLSLTGKGKDQHAACFEKQKNVQAISNGWNFGGRIQRHGFDITNNCGKHTMNTSPDNT